MRPASAAAAIAMTTANDPAVLAADAAMPARFHLLPYVKGRVARGNCTAGLPQNGAVTVSRHSALLIEVRRKCGPTASV